MKLLPRILLLVVTLLLVVMTSLSVPLYWYTRSALEDELDMHLLTTLELVAVNLKTELIALLVTEPELRSVKQAVEANLNEQVVSRIEALAIYNKEGFRLAYTGRLPQDQARMLLSFSKTGQGKVSEIYQTPDGGYLKAALLSITLKKGESIFLVIWGGAGFMSVIDQMLGSLLWITLLALVAGVGLAIIFSRSLIRPVTKLTGYTAAIRHNIYSKPQDLGRRDEFGVLNSALMEMHREIQENEQRNKELLSGIAHEIKNPLGGIEIYTGLLEEELKDNPEHREYLNKIMTELQNLKRIILEYLDYARPPKSNIKPQKIDTIVTDAARLLAPEMEQKNIRFKLEGTGTISGDESKLRRVLVNLLKNSLEAMAEGGIIRITIDDRDSDLVMKISDDGEGIDPELQERIFQPHFSTRDRGYGLGLAIVRNIIDEMHGTIVVKSVVGQGTDFVLTFPVK